MGNQAGVGTRPRLWPPSWLRYLLIWPLVSAYRRRTRSRLSWRLAGSHFATVLVSVIAICVVGTVVIAIASRLTEPADSEAAAEAHQVAQIVEGVRQQGTVSDADLNGIFKGVVSGQLIYNVYQYDIDIQANVGQQMRNIRSVMLIGEDGLILASSDPSLVGRSVESLDDATRSVVAKTLARGSVSPSSDLTVVRADGSIVGANPVRDELGELGGVVVVDKYHNTLPSGLDLLVLVLTFMAQIGVLLLVFVGVPAIPVGIVFGIRRARAISRPISTLAETAGAFAAGDRAARVTVTGHDEIADLQRGFNNMADLLQSTMTTEAEQRALAEHALAANRELIANVSHELRTPVALIRGHLEAIETDPESKDAYLRIALRETDRLEHLVEDLFQLSRLEARQFDLNIAPFDAGSAVRSAVESLIEPARRDAGLTLNAQIAPGDLTCLGDRMRFEQVLLNLIRNAVRYTPEGGIILVSAERDRTGGVVVTVRDTGTGIAAEDLPRVFDRFYRSDQSRDRAGGGAGLGLAIAKELIEAMGGTIAVESVPDEGTVFTIRMPAAPPVRASANGVAAAAGYRR